MHWSTVTERSTKVCHWVRLIVPGFDLIQLDVQSSWQIYLKITAAWLNRTLSDTLSDTCGSQGNWPAAKVCVGS